MLFKQSVCRFYLGRGWLSLNLAMNKVEEDSQIYHSRAASVEMGRTDAGWKICSNIFKLFKKVSCLRFFRGTEEQ